MTLYQFNQLDEMEQIEAFWDGTLVGERQDGEFTVECRQIHSLYVEYRKSNGFYVDMRSFRNPDLLQLHLDQMGNLIGTEYLP
jgi:hypothetical protein